jgi:hypothetical protein
MSRLFEKRLIYAENGEKAEARAVGNGFFKCDTFGD